MIYLASPYSSPIEGAAQLRFEKAQRFAAHCLSQNIHVFSPIVYAHELAALSGMRTDAQFWARFNIDMIRYCEALFIYCIQGWDQSKGIKLELNLAKTLSIPVAYWEEDFSPRIIQ